MTRINHNTTTKFTIDNGKKHSIPAEKNAEKAKAAERKRKREEEERKHAQEEEEEEEEEKGDEDDEEGEDDDESKDLLPSSDEDPDIPTHIDMPPKRQEKKRPATGKLHFTVFLHFLMYYMYSSNVLAISSICLSKVLQKTENG